MPGIYEDIARYSCRRHGKGSHYTDYNTVKIHVNIIRGKHRDYNILSRSQEKDRWAQIELFLRVKHDQARIVRQIREALKNGDPILARRLAMEGWKDHPVNHILQEYARVLSTPRIIQNDIPPSSSIRANNIWLKNHRQEYQGHWIALHDGALVGTANSLDLLVNELGETKGILLTKA